MGKQDYLKNWLIPYLHLILAVERDENFIKYWLSLTDMDEIDYKMSF